MRKGTAKYKNHIVPFAVGYLNAEVDDQGYNNGEIRGFRHGI